MQKTLCCVLIVFFLFVNKTCVGCEMEISPAETRFFCLCCVCVLFLLLFFFFLGGGGCNRSKKYSANRIYYCDEFSDLFDSGAHFHANFLLAIDLIRMLGEIYVYSLDQRESLLYPVASLVHIVQASQPFRTCRTKWSDTILQVSCVDFAT